ncbi:hypothetical protein DV515_00006347, partial [Chloebia gouldiae]
MDPKVQLPIPVCRRGISRQMEEEFTALFQQSEQELQLLRILESEVVVVILEIPSPITATLQEENGELTSPLILVSTNMTFPEMQISSKKTYKQTKTQEKRVTKKCFIFRTEEAKTNLSLRISHDQFISDSPDHTLCTAAGAQAEEPAVESDGVSPGLPALPGDATPPGDAQTALIKKLNTAAAATASSSTSSPAPFHRYSAALFSGPAFRLLNPGAWKLPAKHYVRCI